MKCPKCSKSQDESNTNCILCGLNFETCRQSKKTLKSGSSIADQQVSGISGYLLYTKSSINELEFYGRLIVFIVLFIWGWRFLLSTIDSNYAGKSFMHLVNLPFHEAGHVFFRPFGAFITSLGGSLGQILMPLICMAVLLVKTRDTFGASVALWWVGESFMDMAPYINDARALQLPLLGGNTGASSPYGFHDWEYILTESGLLHHDHLIAKLSFSTGAIFMIVSFFWGSLLLLRQHRKLEK